jgi:hypothetical protein
MRQHNDRGGLAGLCAVCTRDDSKRRNEKRKTSGRTTAAWSRLRMAAILRDGCACRRCGRVGTVGAILDQLLSTRRRQDPKPLREQHVAVEDHVD